MCWMLPVCTKADKQPNISLQLNRSCDPYSILKSLLSCFATKETVAHPSIWKQEQKVMCSGGGGCYCTHELEQKREARFVLVDPCSRIQIWEKSQSHRDLTSKTTIFMLSLNTPSWFYCPWFISLCYSQ